MPAKRIPWFKIWIGATAHGKVRQLEDGVFRTWVELLDAAAQQPVRGRFASRAEAAAVLRRPVKHMAVLIEAGLIDEDPDKHLVMHDWDDWQRWRQEDSNDAPPTPEGPTNNTRTTTERPPNGHMNNSRTTTEGLGNDPSLRARVAKEERREKKEVLETTDVVLSASADVPPKDSRVDEVYEYFKARIQPRSRSCPRKKITTRLRRFTVAELKQGIDHFAEDSWWMQHNASQGAEWFFESDARAEQFLLLERPAPTPINRNGLYRPPESPSPPREYIDVSGFQGLNIKGRGTA